MNHPDNRDQDLEHLLRATLRGEGDDLTPHGDGLAQIQQRIGARRARQLWLRPLAAAGALAVVAGAAIGVYSVTRPGATESQIVQQPTAPTSPLPTLSESPTPTPTPTLVAAFPAGGFYPYVDAAGASAGSLPWAGDPDQVALHFVSDFAGVAGVDKVVRRSIDGDHARVTLGRVASGRTFTVTNVDLTRYDKKAWIVVGAEDAGGKLAVPVPASGDIVTSPLTVAGPRFGVEENVQLSLRTLHMTSPLARTTVSFGDSGGAWTALLKFTPPSDPVGAVVAFEASMMDGGPARLTVTSVRFAAASSGTYPAYFYGIKDGRVTKYSARDGASIAYLTDPQPGGGASDPQRVADHVYYLSGNGTCSNALVSTSTQGPSPTVMVAKARDGYVITSYAVSADETAMAAFETACQPDGSKPQGLLLAWHANDANHPRVTNYQSFPPMLTGDPSWARDDQHLGAVVRTGNEAGCMSQDVFSTWDSASWTNACSDTAKIGGLPVTLQIDGNGTFWIAMQTGDGIQVTRSDGGTTTTAFTIAGAGTPADLAAYDDGTAVLVTNADGRLWRWTTDGGVTELHPKVPQTQVSW